MFFLSYAYPVKLESLDTIFFISSRDIPTAINFATPEEGPEEKAAETLMDEMESLVKQNLPIPLPSEIQDGETYICLPVTFVSKIMLHNAMIEKKVRNVDLAKKLGVPSSEVARITSFKHKTKIDTMVKALKCVGITAELVVREDSDYPWFL